MPNVAKVSIALTEEQIALIRAAVEDGGYATAGEVVGAALRDWQAKRELRQDEVGRLRELWDQGIGSGSAGPIDIDDLRREARSRLDAVRKSASLDM